MAESPFSRIPWDPTPGRRFTLQERLWVRSIPDREADQIYEFVTGAAADDPAMAGEVDRLRDLLQARAFAIAEERVWQSMSSDEQARLIEVAGERGMERSRGEEPLSERLRIVRSCQAARAGCPLPLAARSRLH